jgi:hypothetical protein
VHVLLARTSASPPGANSPADRLVLARARSRAGKVATAQGDYRSASQYMTDSLAIFREVGDASGLAGALGELGRAKMLSGGDPREIQQLLEESLNASRASAEPDDDAWTLGYLGELAMTRRDDRMARVCRGKPGRLSETGRSLVRELV